LNPHRPMKNEAMSPRSHFIGHRREENDLNHSVSASSSARARLLFGKAFIFRAQGGFGLQRIQAAKSTDVRPSAPWLERNVDRLFPSSGKGASGVPSAGRAEG
jgi:hypothetical protein